MIRLGGRILGKSSGILSSNLSNKLVSVFGIGFPTPSSYSISPMTAVYQNHLAPLFILNIEAIFSPHLGFRVVVRKTQVFRSLTITSLSNHGTRTTLFLLRNSCPKMSSKTSTRKAISLPIVSNRLTVHGPVRQISFPSFP